MISQGEQGLLWGRTLDRESLDLAVEALERGGVIAIPTDTVYGLACCPQYDDAIDRIYAIKRRPSALELSLLVPDASSLAGVVTMNARAERLAERFWPGAVSLIVSAREPQRYAIPRTGATLSVRVPAHDLLRALLFRVGPLASTSANHHGQKPAATADDAMKYCGSECDYVLDGGPADGRASTIIDCTTEVPRVLRSGPIGDDELEPYLRG